MASVLHYFGAELHGYALSPPTKPSYFALAGLEHRLVNTIADVRDRAALKHAYVAAQPDIVVHLAAQPLVSVGYANPGETFETNIMGTVNLLDCVREQGCEAVVVMTSDKVYATTRLQIIGKTTGLALAIPMAVARSAVRSPPRSMRSFLVKAEYRLRRCALATSSAAATGLRTV
jgi:nucleoside-diphosphate-sugar epimerase